MSDSAPDFVSDQHLLKQIIDLALDKKAIELVAIDVRGLSSVTDFFVICSGDSEPQVKAIADNIIGIVIVTNETLTPKPKPIKKDAKTILNKNAAATPHAIIFLLFSVANPAAIKPIMIALSAAITISMRIICIEIITCSNIRESMYIRFLVYIKE